MTLLGFLVLVDYAVLVAVYPGYTLGFIIIFLGWKVYYGLMMNKIVHTKNVILLYIIVCIKNKLLFCIQVFF